MIGKPEWFTYRILGWGIRPKTKEGWIYIIVAVLIGVILSTLPFSEYTRNVLLVSFIGIILLDALHIMTQLGKHNDERENYHQLIIERNCSFAAVAALAIVAVYQGIKMGKVDVSIFVVLGIMLAVKIASSVYVRVKM